jgi:hypothetical protein
VFLVNSRLGLVTAATGGGAPRGRQPPVAPLLPRLRGQVAEFLNQCSLDRLGMLYLPTCVGLGYGLPGRSLEAFLGSRGSPTSPVLGSASCLRLADPTRGLPPAGFAWRAPYTLAPRLPARGLGYLPASPHRSPAPRPGSRTGRPPVWATGPALSRRVAGVDATREVPDYQPVVHRLRLSASP